MLAGLFLPKGWLCCKLVTLAGLLAFTSQHTGEGGRCFWVDFEMSALYVVSVSGIVKQGSAVTWNDVCPYTVVPSTYFIFCVCFCYDGDERHRYFS